jgi:hypothetical protein
MMAMGLDNNTAAFAIHAGSATTHKPNKREHAK